jgi:putative methylase
MSRRQLEIQLDKTASFDNPDWHAEQYSTPPSIAANLLWHLHLGDELQGKTVLDLGAGTGRLGLGAVLLGAEHAHLVDIDGAALSTAQANARALGITDDEYTVTMNSAEHYDAPPGLDLAVMNPPFGTQDKGADTAFLEKAAATTDLVLSMHKAATQQFVMEWIVEHGHVLLDQHRISFPLKNTMHHHDRDVEHVDVTAVLFKTT